LGRISGGMGDARLGGMAARSYRELITWQLADEFESEVLRLIAGSAAARTEPRFRGQLEDAVSGVPSNVAEGFSRCSPGDFCRFLDYALASLIETELRLQGGIKRGLFDEPTCQKALLLARRTLTAAVRLKQSQRRYIEQQRNQKRRSPGPDKRKPPRKP
jgi:four helix bundle protein